MSNINNKEEESKKVNILETKEEENNNFEKKFKNFLENKLISVQYKENYANSIPIGAFAFGMTFLVFGFFLSNLYKFDALVLTQLFIFGGLGQITVGIMEFVKGRSFTASFYLIFGMYSITTFGLYFFDKYNLVANNDHKDLTAYYLFWLLIATGFIFCSFKSNVMYTVNIGLIIIMFLLECIGEGVESSDTIKVGGGFCIAAGFVSLYIGFGQLANESFKKNLFPMIPYVENNGIDINYNYKKNN